MRGWRIPPPLLFALLAASIAAEDVNPSALGFSMQEQANHSAPPPPPEASAPMQEDKKIESNWMPSQPDIAQIQQPSMLPYSPTLPSTQNFMPANYYLPGNQYTPPPTTTATEFRSEHYAYPFEPNYPYPVAPPPLDTSLIPTAKHFIIVSFIGLLLLFAVIQNSIAATKRKDALVEILSNRKKREIVASSHIEPMTPEVESALKEDARVQCIQRTLCYENRKLLEDLGVFGKIFAKYLTRSVQSSLKELSPGWDRLVEDAANAGLRGEDCNVVYRDCNLDDSDNATPDEEEDEEEESL